MKTFFQSSLAAFFALFAFQSLAQTVTFETQGRTTTASAVTDHIIKVTNIAVSEQIPPQQVVIPISQKAKTTGDNNTTFTTAAGITVTSGTNGITISDPAASTTLSDNGERKSKNGNFSISLGLKTPGSFYGAGERGHKLNLRGDTLTVYNRQNYGYTGKDRRINQMNITMPLFLTDGGAAIVFDDFAAAKLILQDTIQYITESPLPVTYYYVGGTQNLAQLTQELSQLIGKQPLPPFWSLGYITSKYGYKTQQETIATVDSLKKLGYPLDGIVLDLYWYGKEQDMGRLQWEPDQWPDPKGMLKTLKDKGVNLVAISQPYVLRNGKAIDNYRQLDSNGMFVKDSIGKSHEVKIWVGEGGMFDVSNPDTRKWLADKYSQLTDMGIAGWWGDLGEPEVHPETGIHNNGLSARQYHNKYGNDWSSIISDLFAEKYPDRRLMTLMRGGTIGLQRQSVFPWSTDVSRSWGGLEPQVRIMLNSGLSGLGYMSSDLGGFAVGKNPFIPDLYLRWVEMGLFNPIFRTHAQEFAEPFNYPMHAEKLLQIAKDRYRWLPYNYSLAYENASKGWPLARPLNFYGGKNYDNISDEFLWGKDILVAPVMTENTTSRNVEFPMPGTFWIDMENPAKHFAGGTAQTVNADLNTIPVFVKAGAFIPMADYPMQNTGQYRPDDYTIYYYPFPGQEGSFELFDDNRTSPKSLENNQYRIINFKGATDRNGTSRISINSNGTYPGAPEKIKMTFKVFCPENAQITVNGQETESVFNKENNSITFSVSFLPGKTTSINIK